MIKKCNCKSYNQQTGEIPEVILMPPENLGIGNKSICVDFCISKVIEHLWNKGIVTINSCCGHGIKQPSIILEQNVTNEYAETVKNAIREIDDRDFNLLSWQLVELATENQVKEASKNV